MKNRLFLTAMGMLSQALSSGENNSPGVARRQGVVQPNNSLPTK